MNIEWFKKRWFELRLGYSIYISFPLGVMNFIMGALVLVKLYFPTFGLGKELAILFALIIAPVSIVLGNLHIRYQQDADNKMRYKLLLDKIKELKENIEELKERVK